MQDLITVTTIMTTKEISQANRRLIAAMNEALDEDDFSMDEVLTAALYAIGHAHSENGIVLAINDPLGTALSPFVDGYKAHQKLTLAS